MNKAWQPTVEEVADAVRSIMEKGVYSRGQAAIVLKHVGECCMSGRWPEDVTMYAFGESVSRAIETAHDGQAVLGEFLRGYMAQAVRTRRLDGPPPGT